MDATLRDKAAEFAKKFCAEHFDSRELSDVLRLMSKSMIEQASSRRKWMFILARQSRRGHGSRRGEGSAEEPRPRQGRREVGRREALPSQSPQRHFDQDRARRAGTRDDRHAA